MAIAFDVRTLSRLSFHTMGRYPDTLPNHQREQPDYQRYFDLYNSRLVIRPFAALAATIRFHGVLLKILRVSPGSCLDMSWHIV